MEVADLSWQGEMVRVRVLVQELARGQERDPMAETMAVVLELDLVVPRVAV